MPKQVNYFTFLMLYIIDENDCVVFSCGDFKSYDDFSNMFMHPFSVQYVACQTPLPVEEVEILAVKRCCSTFCDKSVDEASSFDELTPLVIDPSKDELETLQGHEPLTGIKSKCISQRGHLVSMKLCLFPLLLVVLMMANFFPSSAASDAGIQAEGVSILDSFDIYQCQDFLCMYIGHFQLNTSFFGV